MADISTYLKSQFLEHLNFGIRPYIKIPSFGKIPFDLEIPPLKTHFKIDCILGILSDRI